MNKKRILFLTGIFLIIFPILLGGLFSGHDAFNFNIPKGNINAVAVISFISITTGMLLLTVLYVKNKDARKKKG